MRKSMLGRSSLLMVCLLLLFGCATAPKAPSPKDPEPGTLVASPEALAPRGGEAFHTLLLRATPGNAEALRSWTLEIATEPGRTVLKSWKGEGRSPAEVSWEGMGDDGTLVPDGNYRAYLRLEYDPGLNPATLRSAPFTVVVTPPMADLLTNPITFPYVSSGELSPATLALSLKPGLGRPTAWGLRVTDGKGALVRSFDLDLPVSQLEWDGRDAKGAFLTREETYVAQLYVKDQYGNRSESSIPVKVLGVPGAENSSVEVWKSGFSPLSAKGPRTLDLSVIVGSKAAVNTWSVRILDTSDRAVRAFSGNQDSVPETLAWDGLDNDGRLVSDGAYRALLEVDYGARYKPAEVESRPFYLSSSPPKVKITMARANLSLASLGPYNPLTLTLEASSPRAQLATWELSIQDSAGKVIATKSANWPNASVQWDGSTSDGSALAPGGRYGVLVSLYDEYGNLGRASATLFLDGLPAAPEESAIEALAAGLGPMGDGSAATLGLALYPGAKEAVRQWHVAIIGGPGIVARTYGDDTSQVPTRLSWDGKTDAGTLAPEGRYHAQLTLGYGTTYSQAEVSSADFLLVTTAPKVSLVASPRLFSPDQDGADDVARFSIGADTGLPSHSLTAWSLKVLDPEGVLVREWSGPWPAGEVSWDGLGKDGNLVDSASDYRVIAQVSDGFGNAGTAEARLPTDVLVLATQEGLRIRVPGIVFKAYTADYRSLPAELAQRNASTLDLLAAKLRRFPDYRVRVEGHAVMVNWDNPQKGQAEQEAVLLPLSLSRAKAIMEALAERGIPKSSMEALGVGALNPLVPDSDLQNRWKNRRVEFFLVR